MVIYNLLNCKASDYLLEIKCVSSMAIDVLSYISSVKKDLEDNSSDSFIIVVRYE